MNALLLIIDATLRDADTVSCNVALYQ